MSEYPPAPWTLGGWGIATFGLVDANAAAKFVPDGAQIVTLKPGKTIGGLFFLSYERGSLIYHELNVVSGVVRVGSRFAFFLPRLYVDSPASLAGGREIWSVPKELAGFEIERDASTASIRVRQGDRDVCRLTCTTFGPRLRLPLPLPSLGVREDAFLFFTGSLVSTAIAVRAQISLPHDSEFNDLVLDGPRFGVRCDDLTLKVPAPRAVPRAVAAFVTS